MKEIDERGAVRIKWEKLTLARDNKANRVSTLRWHMREAFPKLTVFINGPDRSITGAQNMINLSFTYKNLLVLFGFMDLVIESDVPVEKELVAYNTAYIDNQRTDDIVIEGKAVIGKDSNGVVYITLVDKDDTKPQMRFNLIADEKWLHAFDQGIQVPIGEMSTVFAKEYLNMLRLVYGQALFVHEMDGLTNTELKKNTNKTAMDSTTTYDL